MHSKNKQATMNLQERNEQVILKPQKYTVDMKPTKENTEKFILIVRIL